MDDELIRCFEAGDVPAGGFHHEQHVRVAWNYVSRYRYYTPERLWSDAARQTFVEPDREQLTERHSLTAE